MISANVLFIRPMTSSIVTDESLDPIPIRSGFTM